MTVVDLVRSATDLIRSRVEHQPSIGVILGSGLGGLADRILKPKIISYPEIPGWARSTASGHRGRLVSGEFEGAPILAVDGRFHRYEGWSADAIVFPVRVMAALGVQTLIVSNAAGGIHAQFKIGDIMVIAGHIDLQFGNLNSRFRTSRQPTNVQSTTTLARGNSPYDPVLAELAFGAARTENFAVYQGVYLATLGPNYETRAEYRMMRRIGADAVGMSTVPEVLEAQRLEIRVLAMSMISNLARPDTPAKASHEEVLAAGSIAEPKMTAIVRRIVQERLSLP